jgi:vacuolar protein-sorting-associated protein 4
VISQAEFPFRRHIRSELIAQLDALNQTTLPLLIIGETSAPWNIDHSTRKRFERRAYVGLPDPPARRQVLVTRLGYVHSLLSAQDIEAAVAETEGFTHSEIVAIVRKAAAMASTGPGIT